MVNVGGAQTGRTKHAGMLRALAAGELGAAEPEAIDHVEAGRRLLGVHTTERP